MTYDCIAHSAHVQTGAIIDPKQISMLTVGGSYLEHARKERALLKAQSYSRGGLNSCEYQLVI